MFVLHYPVNEFFELYILILQFVFQKLSNFVKKYIFQKHQL